MEYPGGFNRRKGSKTRILYSPSTHRVIARVSADLIGTIQLDKTFRAERVIYAAPVDMDEMADSWSNQDIDDWEERNIRAWADLTRSRTGQISADE